MYAIKRQKRSNFGEIETFPELGPTRAMCGTALEIKEAAEGIMTTDTLNFPVFHSDQGVESDTVQFSQRTADGVTDITKVKDLSGHIRRNVYTSLFVGHRENRLA